MDAYEKDLHQRDKATLIAIIKQLLQLQPDLAWVLDTVQPVSTQGTQTFHSAPYRQRIQAAITAASEHDRDRRYREEMRNTLTAIQTIAAEHNQRQESLAALAIYEVLLSEVTEHFNDVRSEYVIFTTTLYSCIDGLDTCFADSEEHAELRLRVLKALFAIYRFVTDAGMHLEEDIPGLLTANANAAERQIIADWVREAQASSTNKQWASDAQAYRTLLRQLEKP